MKINHSHRYLTIEEQQVLKTLRQLQDKFEKLHGVTDLEQRQYIQACGSIADIIAYRVCHREMPDLFGYDDCQFPHEDGES